MSLIQWCCERGAKSHVAKEISGRGPKKLRSREKGNQGVGDSRSITFKIFALFFILITFLYHFFLYIFHPRHLPRPSTTIHDLYLPPTISDARFRVRTKPQTATVNLRPIHTRGFAPEHAPGARSGSKAPPCVPTISWVYFILESRISTPQNAPRY